MNDIKKGKGLENALRSAVTRLNSVSLNGGDSESIIDEFTEEIGFNHFIYLGWSSYFREPHKQRLGGFPKKFMELFVAQSYHEICPVAQHTAHSSLPLYWSNKRGVQEYEGRIREMFLEALGYGIGDCFVVPFHGRGGEHGCITFARAVEKDPIQPWDPLYQHIIALAPYVHGHMMAQVELSPAHQEQQEVLLTKPERECLIWVIKGKTAWETAQIIGCTKRTVDFHLQKATRKMGASNKIHAAVIAMRTGLI